VVEIIVEQQIAALVGAHVDYTKKGKREEKGDGGSKVQVVFFQSWGFRP